MNYIPALRICCCGVIYFFQWHRTMDPFHRVFFLDVVRLLAWFLYALAPRCPKMLDFFLRRASRTVATPFNDADVRMLSWFGVNTCKLPTWSWLTNCCDFLLLAPVLSAYETVYSVLLVLAAVAPGFQSKIFEMLVVFIRSSFHCSRQVQIQKRSKMHCFQVIGTWFILFACHPLRTTSSILHNRVLKLAISQSLWYAVEWKRKQLSLWLWRNFPRPLRPQVFHA